MRSNLKTSFAVAAFAAALLPAPGFADVLDAFGLTADQRLIQFDRYDPKDLDVVGAIALDGDDTEIVGIDFRVQTGALYGVGDLGGVYVIDTDTAVGTLVSQLTVPLEGSKFGVDFNPAADRLRIVSDTGQNLRHNVNAGGTTTADLALNYTAGTPTLGVTAVAYTNNDLDASTATTLFDIDTALDQLVIQSPPNNGSLAPTGQLRVDAADGAGLDIFTNVHRGIAVNNEAFAVLTTGGVSRLFRVSLLTGKARSRGPFQRRVVVDIAIPLDRQ